MGVVDHQTMWFITIITDDSQTSHTMVVIKYQHGGLDLTTHIGYKLFHIHCFVFKNTLQNFCLRFLKHLWFV